MGIRNVAFMSILGMISISVADAKPPLSKATDQGSFESSDFQPFDRDAIPAVPSCLPDVPGASIVVQDFIGDNKKLRKAGLGNQAVLNGTKPDIVCVRYGNVLADDYTAPFVPEYWGEDYFRFDMVVAGLVNPPGPAGLVIPGVTATPYNPTKYGPNPIYSMIEFNVDRNNGTGAELKTPELTFLGTYPRFGFRAAYGVADRTARRWADFAEPFLQLPRTKHTGSDFILRLVGDETVTGINKSFPMTDADSVFEAGETWEITSRMFMRATGYEFVPFWGGTGSNGWWRPLSKIRFKSEPEENRTVITMIYSLTNKVQPNDFNPNNETSVGEAINALILVATGLPTGAPEDILLNDWIYQSPFEVHIQSRNWIVRATAATAFVSSPGTNGGLPLVYTDALAPFQIEGTGMQYYQQVPGDYNGDGFVNVDDDFDDDGILHFIKQFDANLSWDADATLNGAIVIPNFPKNFSPFDRDYDGRVDEDDFID